ncbi:MAG: S8 family serine peptidase, partial [Candidatus Hodarchaeales archaeon]
GHGTHVAGLAAGASTGIAPEAEIYSAKIVETGVTGAGGGNTEETTAGMLDAIDYLVNNSVDVINISLGQYHNIPDGLRDEIINYISIMHNIVFSISIGNSGSSYGDRATLNNPGTALQCIAVTFTNSEETAISNHASRGPKADYSLKPDIAAPGTNLDGPSYTGTGTIKKSGTSMASPIVGGAAALLIDYLKKNSRNYTTGTIKAALLAGTQSLGEPVWEEGAGFLNVTRSWQILNSSFLDNNIPDIGYLHPSQLPLDPYKVLFTGSTVEFNLTAITSIPRNVSLTISSPLSEFVNAPDTQFLLNNSRLIPINFSIPKTAIPQFVTGTISLGDLTLDVEFEIRKPKARILFDESLNKIVRHGYSSPGDVYEIQGDSSNTIGMYSEFTKFLSYENNYSVTPHISGDLTSSKLAEFDILILANPLSLTTDIYMDWISDPGNDYYSISETAKDAISQYINFGGSLLVFNTLEPYFNISATNDLIRPFDIQIQSEFSPLIRMSEFTNHSLNFTDSIDSFPFRGHYLQSLGNYTQIIAEYEGNPTIIAYEGPAGGRVIIFGSDLIFDNIGLSGYAYSGNKEQNHVLAYNSIAWLAQGEYRETTTTNIPEFPLYIVFLSLIVALGVIYYIFTLKNRN